MRGYDPLDRETAAARMPTNADEAAWKRCPECAELVRAQARRCRFCGWRFDGRPAVSLAPPSRERDEPSDLAAVLDGWGVQLAAGERPAFFVPSRIVRADGFRADGFLLVTDRDVRFLANAQNAIRRLVDRRHTAIPEEAFRARVSALGHVEPTRVRLRRGLSLTVAGHEAFVFGIERATLDAIVRHLREHARGSTA